MEPVLRRNWAMAGIIAMVIDLCREGAAVILQVGEAAARIGHEDGGVRGHGR